MSVFWCVAAWVLIFTRKEMLLKAASFWFLLAVFNELMNPVCPGVFTRSMLFFASSMGYLMLKTGWIEAKEK